MQPHTPQELQTKLNGWLLLIAGGLLCLGLGSLSGCRKDQAPQIPIGIGDGFGGANMDIPGVGKEYWPPSKLENAWITTQKGAEDLISWCYKTDSQTARVLLQQRQQEQTKSASPRPENSPAPGLGN